MTTAKSETTLGEQYTQWQLLSQMYDQGQQQCDEIWNNSPPWYRSPTLTKADADRICASIEREMHSKLSAVRSLALSAKIKALLLAEISTHAERCARWEADSRFASQSDCTGKISDQLDALTRLLIATPTRNTHDLNIKLSILYRELTSAAQDDELPCGLKAIVNALRLAPTLQSKSRERHEPF